MEKDNNCWQCKTSFSGHYHCEKCNASILVGEDYFAWIKSSTGEEQMVCLKCDIKNKEGNNEK